MLGNEKFPNRLNPEYVKCVSLFIHFIKSPKVHQVIQVNDTNLEKEFLLFV